MKNQLVGGLQIGPYGYTQRQGLPRPQRKLTVSFFQAGSCQR